MFPIPLTSFVYGITNNIYCINTFFASLVLPAPPLSCPSFLNDHVTVFGGVSLHLPEVDVCGLHYVSQTRPRLEHLIEVPHQCDEDVPILSVVKDVTVDDLCTVAEGGVFG